MLGCKGPPEAALGNGCISASLNFLLWSCSKKKKSLGCGAIWGCTKTFSSMKLCTCPQMSHPLHGTLNCSQQRRNPQRLNTSVEDLILLLRATRMTGPQQIYVLRKSLTPGLPGLGGSPGRSKENRHTCLSKHRWFPSPAVSSKQDWSDPLPLPLRHASPLPLHPQTPPELRCTACEKPHLTCPVQHSSALDPRLRGCSFHGLRSAADDPLAEIIHQMGEGCFLNIPSTSVSSMKRSRGVRPHDIRGYVTCQGWDFQREAPTHHSALEEDLLQPRQLTEIRFPLEAGRG